MSEQPAAIPPVDWTGLRPAAEGPRHYEGPEVAARSVWNCPACAAHNEGPLELGCASCGGGGGAAHVGIDPIVRGKKPQLTAAVIAEVQAKQVVRGLEGNEVAKGAFLQWIAIAGAEVGPFASFLAGWHAAVRLRGDLMTEPTEPTSTAVETEVNEEADAEAAALPGTPRQRTLIAALEYFRDQVLAQQPEEIFSGEWISGADLAEWIQELKEQLPHD